MHLPTWNESGGRQLMRTSIPKHVPTWHVSGWKAAEVNAPGIAIPTRYAPLNFAQPAGKTDGHSRDLARALSPSGAGRPTDCRLPPPELVSDDATYHPSTSPFILKVAVSVYRPATVRSLSGVSCPARPSNHVGYLPHHLPPPSPLFYIR